MKIPTGKNDHGSKYSTPRSDIHRKKFAHESWEKAKARGEQENADQARKALREIQTKTYEQLEFEFPPVIIPGLLYKGRRAMVTGKPFDGKGLLLTQMACCVATGEEFLGFKIPKPMKVFIADFELMEAQLKERIEGFIKVTAKDDCEREKRLRRLISENLKMACYLRKQNWLHHPEAFHDIARRARFHESELIVLDPGWRLRRSEMIEADIRAFLEGLNIIENKTGASIVYAQHQTKGPQENKAVSERSSGRYDFARDAATVLTLTSDGKNPVDGLFKVEGCTNDFAQPDVFHILREFPLFRVLSSF
jgi:RecA-family ATPase